MPRLTDTQLVILSAAAQRHDSVIPPLPKSLKIRGGAVTKPLEGLCKKGLLEEISAARNAAAWREGENEHPVRVDIAAKAGCVGVDEAKQIVRGEWAPLAPDRGPCRRNPGASF